jgi:dipeptidyl aminopeptidase/acylaminoacyl peptidase
MRGTALIALLYWIGIFSIAEQGLARPFAQPFSVRDLQAVDRITDPQVAPDGKFVVFVVRETDLEANLGRTDLWIVSTDGTGLRRLTSHPESDSNPRWGPDGRTIWFLSSRSGSSQVWRIAVDGGEAAQMTNEPLDVGNLVVAPDGQHIAYTMEVFPDDKTVQDTKVRLEKLEKRKATGRVYESLFVRHWDAWEDGRRSHLFVKHVRKDFTPYDRLSMTVRSVDVMKGMDADTPSQPFGGPEEIAFTPDSTGIVFTAKNVGREEAWSTNFDLYYAPANAERAPRCLTGDNQAWDSHPVFSPDGKTLAYLAMSRPGYEADQFRIVLRDWPDGSPRVLAPKWDRSASALGWSGDGTSLYAIAGNVGQESLFAFDSKSGDVRTIIREGTVHAISPIGNQIVYSLSTLRSPAHLYSVRNDGTHVRELTPFLPGVGFAQMGDYEQFSFAGWNDETVYAYVVKPVGFEAGKKYPVAFLIHGGPQGSYGNVFHYRWNPQAYAGAGYAVVMVDFHGSTGYGQAFCDSIRGDWGGKPLVDLQKGLAAALSRYPWMDGDRVGALGASFGGYMVNWIAGRWPDRFRCLVNHDGSLDERLAYFDTEELWFPEWDHKGTPWDNPAGYEDQNPLRFVDRWKTPMLVIHGGLDFRVPLTQGLSTFNALQRRGIASKLLYFPDENHWVLKPHNSILWHETVIAWLDQWLKKP